MIMNYFICYFLTFVKRLIRRLSKKELAKIKYFHLIVASSLLEQFCWEKSELWSL